MKAKNDISHPLNQTNEKGLTLLYISCRNGNTEIVRNLINLGADLNIKIRNEFIIETAIRWSYFDIIYLILETKQINLKNIEKIANKYTLDHKIINMITKIYPDYKGIYNLKYCC